VLVDRGDGNVLILHNTVRTCWENRRGVDTAPECECSNLELGRQVAFYEKFKIDISKFHKNLKLIIDIENDILHQWV
jgi:hypothetical protein